MQFTDSLVNWYKENGRNLPWRNTSNPYYIWVSEVILQQTRVAQGIDFFYNFISEFPTLHHLATASEDKVMKAWQGLGYYTRARNLQRGARWIIENHGGEVPQSYSELLKVPGLGPYSAGAIASFAYNIEVPAIDGNVYRIVSRFFGVFDSPHTAKGKKVFTQIVKELIPSGKANVFNQALLDFGALQCVPRSPKCQECPFEASCYAYRNNLVAQLPVRAPKQNVRARYLNFIVIRCQGYTFLSKRASKDIWHSLYEFPLIETQEMVPLERLSALPLWHSLFGRSGVYVRHVSPVKVQKLSHQVLNIRFVIVEILKASAYLKRNYRRFEVDRVGTLSVPVIIDNFLAAEPYQKYIINA